MVLAVSSNLYIILPFLFQEPLSHQRITDYSIIHLLYTDSAGMTFTGTFPALGLAKGL